MGEAMSEARRLLEDTKQELLQWHGRCAMVDRVDAFLARPDTHDAEVAVLVEALKAIWLSVWGTGETFIGVDLGVNVTASIKLQPPHYQRFKEWAKMRDAALADTSPAAAALLAQEEQIKMARGKVMMIDASPAGSLNAQLKADALAALAPGENP